MTGGERRDRLEAVILAAGKGTRMKSDLAKVLHLLAGRPLLDHVLDAVEAAAIDRTVVVVGHQAERVRERCARPGLEFVVQAPQLGTGHAVQTAAPLLDPDGWTVVLSGDVPLLRAATIRSLVDRARGGGAAAAVLTCVAEDAGSYGRIVKDGDGRLARIVEARDATEAELAIGEYNTGVYCYRTAALLAALGRLSDDNDQREYYLTDTIAHIVAAGLPVEAVVTDDPDEVVGINTVDELAAAERLLAARSGAPGGRA